MKAATTQTLVAELEPVIAPVKETKQLTFHMLPVTSWLLFGFGCEQNGCENNGCNVD